MDVHLLSIFVREIRLQSKFALTAFKGMQDEFSMIDERREADHQIMQALIDRQRIESSNLFNRINAEEIEPKELDRLYAELFEAHRLELLELAEDIGHWPVFYFAYSFLLHAAIVSKILWPGPSVHGREKRKVGPDKVGQLLEIHKDRGPAVRDALKVTDDLLPALKNTDIRDDLEHYDERLEAWYVSSSRRNLVDLGLMPRSGLEGLDESDFRRNLDPNTLDFYIEGTDFNLITLANELYDVDQRARTWLRQRRDIE